MLCCLSGFRDLIPREKLFQKPSCIGIKISPDAKELACIGADKSGTMNLYLSSQLGLEGAQMITHFKEPSIKGFHWMPDSKHIILLKDKDGTGNFRLYSIDLGSQEIIDHTADYEKINAKVFQVSATENKAVIGINSRNPKFHDLFLLDLEKNTLTQFYQNNQFINFVFDDDLDIHVKVKMNEDCSITLFDKNEEILFSLSAEEAFHTECLKFSSKDRALYIIDNRNCNTTQFKKIFLDKNDSDVLIGHDAKSDITDVYFEENEPVLYTTYYLYQEWHPLNDKIKSDIDFLISKIDSNFEIVSRSSNHEYWVLKTSLPDVGIEFWLYDRSHKQLSLLYSFPQIANLAKMYPFEIPSRDGLTLVSYLTLPVDMDQGGNPSKPLPLVVFPHGGPFKVRDCYEYCPYHQWFASRGYAVLSVNFRLSSGFGKDFVNAGNGEWGKKAHQDVLDAVQWCIDRKIAEEGKIAIFGGSYGGYEALSALTFSPDAFNCAVAICGPSNLKTVLDGVPFYWEFPIAPLSDKMMYFTKKAFVKSMGGDPDKDEGIAYLHSVSPLNHVDKIQKPLLLVHGANDHIVAGKESDQIFEKMQQNELAALYISFPDEGHHIAKHANVMCYLAYSEWFLASVLGGRYEPISDKELKASSAIIRSSSIDAKVSADLKCSEDSL